MNNKHDQLREEVLSDPYGRKEYIKYLEKLKKETAMELPADKRRIEFHYKFKDCDRVFTARGSYQKKHRKFLTEKGVFMKPEMVVKWEYVNE